MRIVLDEDIDVRLRHHFGQGNAVETVEYRGWKGLRNGDLLRAMAASGTVDAFITADQKLRHQQNLFMLPFGTLVMRPARNRLAELVWLMPEGLERLSTLHAGDVIEVPYRPVT